MMFLWALCELIGFPEGFGYKSGTRGSDSVLGGLPFGVYAIAQNFNIPLQVQPQVFMALCLVSWAQILVYGKRQGFCARTSLRCVKCLGILMLILWNRKWSAWKAALVALAVAAVFAGVEAALIITLTVRFLLSSSSLCVNSVA